MRSSPASAETRSRPVRLRRSSRRRSAPHATRSIPARSGSSIQAARSSGSASGRRKRRGRAPQPTSMPPDGAASPTHRAASRNDFFYGGQAVIEGVMMRGRRHYAVAVRVPVTQEIRVERGALTAGLYTHPVWKLPFIRGLALLAEQLHLGTRSLSWSAQVNAGAQDVRIGRREVAISLTVAVALSVGLFFGLPLLGASLAVHRANSLFFVLVEGVIRVGLVLAYLSLISLVPDV